METTNNNTVNNNGNIVANYAFLAFCKNSGATATGIGDYVNSKTNMPFKALVLKKGNKIIQRLSFSHKLLDSAKLSIMEIANFLKANKDNLQVVEIDNPDYPGKHLYSICKAGQDTHVTEVDLGIF